MKVTEKEAAELYRSMTARGRQRGSDCLDDDLLLRVSTNDLRAPERERIAAHIAQCSDCAREYRVARAMRPFETDARSTLGRRASPWWAAAAAVLAVAVAGATVWQWAARIGDLRREVAAQQQELSKARRALALQRTRVHSPAPPQPQLAVPIVDLDPEPTRGAAAPAPTIEVPKGTDEFTLVLHLPGGIRLPAEIEIDNAGGAVWRGTAERTDSGAVTLALHRALIPAGDYTIRVRSGQRQATFPFRAIYR